MNISMRMLQLRGKTNELMLRFPAAVCWQVIGFFVGAAIILLRSGGTPPFDTASTELFDHLVRLIPALAGAWLTAAVCRLLADTVPIKRATLLSAAASAALFATLACTWYGVEKPSSYLLIGTGGVLFALSFLALFFLERSNNAPGLPALLFAAGFSFGTSILLFIGLTICSAAFWALVFTNADAWTTETSYLFIGLIAYHVWGLSAFLGALPKAGERYEFSFAAEKVLLYLLFPVYALLLIVLYLYVGKIILAGEMPVGTMNWYASFALFGFVFLFSTLAVQKRLPLFDRFLKWGLLLFLPILAVQLYGVYLRYEAYGLTMARYASMVCTVCGIYALITAFLRRKPQQIYLCAAILALIFTLTPLNIVDVPLHSQEIRLSRILTENNLVQDGQFVMRDDTPPEVIEEIKDIAFYIGEESSPLAADIISESYGVKGLRQTKIYDIFFDSHEAVDITGYQTLHQFSIEDISPEGFLTIRQADNSEERIDLAPYIARVTAYAEEHNTFTLPKELQEYEVGEYRLHFDGIYFTRTADGGINYFDTNGFALMR